METFFQGVQDYSLSIAVYSQTAYKITGADGKDHVSVAELELDSILVSFGIFFIGIVSNLIIIFCIAWNDSIFCGWRNAKIEVEYSVSRKNSTSS